MNIYPNFRLFKRVFISLLSIGLLIDCNPIQAQNSDVLLEKVIYGSSNGDLTDQGLLRTYYIYTPKSYVPSHPMPLVLVFHGDNGSGHVMSEVSRFNELAEQKGFIVVYPDGVNNKWRLRKKSQRQFDDISFVDHLIDHLQQQRSIDNQRIYATGFSKGAILTQALACHLADKIAAFASVAGSLPVKLQQKCQPQAPVSILMINGTNDQSVHYLGDNKTQKKALISIPEAVNFWRSHDQCPSAATKDVAFAQSKHNSRFSVKTYSYSECRAGSEVLHLAVLNGGHLWYGGTSTDEKINKFNKDLGFNSTQTIWSFFERHSLPSV